MTQDMQKLQEKCKKLETKLQVGSASVEAGSKIMIGSNQIRGNSLVDRLKQANIVQIGGD